MIKTGKKVNFIFPGLGEEMRNDERRALCSPVFTVYDQYHHFNFSFVSIILDNVDEFWKTR